MGNRLGAGGLMAAATAVATIAFAQSRSPMPASSSSAPAAGDAQAVSPPPSTFGDGGVRWSPLNPPPEERPQAKPARPFVDYDSLLAEVAALRARVAVAGDNLFAAKVSIALELESSRARIDRLVVSLDDGVVFVAPARFAAEDPTPVYDHAVSPGKHSVTVDIDRHDERDDSFRTSQRSRFMIDVPKDHRVELEVRLVEDSSMGGDFPSSGSGTYDLRVRAKAHSRAVTR